MKRSIKSLSGVTLLEILLVLAVAAMIIIMSVRYYQSAQTNTQVNATMETIQAITAAADSYLSTKGSYGTSNTALQTAIQAQMPNQQLQAPWGAQITIPTAATTKYSVSIPSTPANVCSNLLVKLSASTKYTSMTPTTCPTTGSITFGYTYDSTK